MGSELKHYTDLKKTNLVRLKDLLISNGSIKMVCEVKETIDLLNTIIDQLKMSGHKDSSNTIQESVPYIRSQPNHNSAISRPQSNYNFIENNSRSDPYSIQHDPYQGVQGDPYRGQEDPYNDTYFKFYVPQYKDECDQEENYYDDYIETIELEGNVVENFESENIDSEIIEPENSTLDTVETTQLEEVVIDDSYDNDMYSEYA